MTLSIYRTDNIIVINEILSACGNRADTELCSVLINGFTLNEASCFRGLLRVEFTNRPQVELIYTIYRQR